MVGIFAHVKDTPREALGWRMFFCAAVVGMTGAARGLDEGIISGIVVLPSWIASYGIQDGDAAEANAVSMVQIGCVLGSILGYFVIDRFGRVKTLQLSCLIWILGSIIWMCSAGSVPLLYVGRFISGTGIGFTPVFAPTYLVEIAPRTVRGATVVLYSGSVYLGILLGYFTNYGVSRSVSDTSDAQWRIPICLNFIFAGVVFILSFFIAESPRWLIKQGRDEEGAKALSWLRNMRADHPYLLGELTEIKDKMAREKDVLKQATWKTGWVKLFTSKSNLARLAMALNIQLFGQLSGGGTMTVYAPKIVAFTKHGASTDSKLLTTAVFGIVKLVSSMIAAVFLIDLLGRKKSVMTGVSLQMICSIYLGIFIKLKVIDNPITAANETASDVHYSQSALAAVMLSGVAWAIGINSVQYLMSTEIFQIESRALATAIIMAFHFLAQYASSRLFPVMLTAWNSWKPFAVFFPSVCAAMLVFVVFCLPETSGVSVEDMDSLFTGPWYTIGLRNWHRKKESEGAHMVFSDELNAEPGLTYRDGAPGADTETGLDKSKKELDGTKVQTRTV